MYFGINTVIIVLYMLNYLNLNVSFHLRNSKIVIKYGIVKL